MYVCRQVCMWAQHNIVGRRTRKGKYQGMIDEGLSVGNGHESLKM